MFLRLITLRYTQRGHEAVFGRMQKKFACLTVPWPIYVSWLYWLRLSQCRQDETAIPPTDYQCTNMRKPDPDPRTKQSIILLLAFVLRMEADELLVTAIYRGSGFNLHGHRCVKTKHAIAVHYRRRACASWQVARW